MIQMWDDSFSLQDKRVSKALKDRRALDAFELMHNILDEVWQEVGRILKPGGFVCINIGDATRTVDANFMLYPNHSRILSSLLQKGFTPLPVILWRKQTNAPNKFMGSGMLPAGAYITLEHEYVLIARKGPKREFCLDADKSARRASAIFWEERNDWFSDIWFDLKGTVQKMNDSEVRKRSGAFPFELPYRLINMFSVKGDWVVDPFSGIGTTMLAAMASARNSIGYEIAEEFLEPITQRVKTAVDMGNDRIADRLNRHLDFVEKRMKNGKPFKYLNRQYGFPVITRQEQDLILNRLNGAAADGKNRFVVSYDEEPQARYCDDWTHHLHSSTPNPSPKSRGARKKNRKDVQLRLFD